MARFFISYKMLGEDSLADDLAAALRGDGHEVFVARDSIRLGQRWPETVSAELDRSDYFMLLLSQAAATSEMVKMEVRHAYERAQESGRPVMLPIRVKLPVDASLNLDLDAYLSDWQQARWDSPADTPRIVAELRQLVADGGSGRSVAALDEQEPSPISVTPPSLSPLEHPMGSAMATGSTLYLEREGVDDLARRAIGQPRQLLFLVGVKQSGKSSLLVRLVERARQQQCNVAQINFQMAGSQALATERDGLRWFCRLLARGLGLSWRTFDDDWVDDFGPMLGCMSYLEDMVLARVEGPIVIAIEELDLVYDYQAFGIAFLTLLRQIFEDGATKAGMARLCIVATMGSERHFDALPPTQSPLNVGNKVELRFCREDELRDLADRHQLALSVALMDDINEWLGGHIYLARLFIYHAALAAREGRGESEMRALLDQGADDVGIFADHLKTRLWLVRTDSDRRLAEDLSRAVRSDGPVSVDPDVSSRLRGMGLVTSSGGTITPMCRLYREYFRTRL